MSEQMRRALAELAKEIEELKFKYIEAERSNNSDRMELLLNELDILEAYYNHQAAILNGDVSTNLSQEDQFLRSVQNSTFDNPSSDVHSTVVSDTFRSRWVKLHEHLQSHKRQAESTQGFCYICLSDVHLQDLILFSCGHSVCIGECGVRLPTPICPAPACNTNIEHVFDNYELQAERKRKAEECNDALADRMRYLRSRGFVPAPAPPVLLTNAPIHTPSVLPIAPDIIVIDDDEEQCDDDEVVFVECRKP